MKFFNILFTLLILALGTQAIAQKTDDDHKAKKEKKVVIIKKKVDKDGNVVIEKIVKEGDEADELIWISEDGNEYRISKKKLKSKNSDKEIEIIGKDLDAYEIITLEDLDSVPKGIEKRLKDFDIEIEKTGDDNKCIIKIKKDGEEAQTLKLKWRGDEMPEDIKEKLNEKGIYLLHIGESEDDRFVYKFWHENKAFLGVQIGSKATVENVDGEEAKTVEGENGEGAVILGIIEGGAAEAAGLKKDDVIKTIGGVMVKGHEDLVEALDKYEPGDKVAIGYVRVGKSDQTEATLTGPKDVKGIHLWMDEDGEENRFRGKAHFFKNEEDSDGGIIVKTEKVIIIKTGEGEEESEISIEAISEEESEEREEPHDEPTQTLDIEEINLFPNPTDGVLQLQFKAEAVPTTITVTDISGKEIFTKSLNDFDGNYNAQVDVSTAAKGTLLLTISQGKKSFSEKIILE